MPTYIRNAGPFSKTTLGQTFSESLASGTYFWDNESSQVNVLYLIWSGVSGGAGTPSYLVHINLTTGDSYIMEASELTNSSSTLLNFSSFAYYNDKLYFAEYGGDGKCYLYCYDGAGTLNQFYITTATTEVPYIMTLGTDNNIYLGTTTAIYQVATADLTVTRFGSAYHASYVPTECRGIISDGVWIYIVWKDSGGHIYETTYKIADGTKTYEGEGDNYTTGFCRNTAVSGWQFKLGSNVYDLTVSGGSAPRSQTFTGEYSAGSDTPSYNYEQYYRTTKYVVNADYIDENNHVTPWAGYYVDSSAMAPWDGNLSVTFYYKNAVDWESIVLTFPENPSNYIKIINLMPMTSDTVMIFPVAYGNRALYNVDSKTITDYLGVDGISMYSYIGQIGSLWYWLGYPFQIAVYDATGEWTWTPQNILAGNPHSGVNNQTIPKWPYYVAVDKNGVIWAGGNPKDGSSNTFAYWNPDTEDTDGWISLTTRSVGIAAGGAYILAGNSASGLRVYDADTLDIVKTIDLSTAAGFTGQVFVANEGVGNVTLAIVSDESTNYKMLKINVVTEDITAYDLPTGLPFGFVGSSRNSNRFLKGPDNYYYFFGGTSSQHLYAVDMSGNFTDLGDMGTYYMPTFIGTKVLFSKPTSNTLYSIEDLFEQTFPNSAPLGIEGGQPGGMPGGHVDGI